MNPEFEKHLMAGLPLARMRPKEASSFVRGVARSGSQGLAVHFVTAHTIALAERGQSLRSVLDSGDLLLPDSRWLELLSGGIRRQLVQVRGPDFFREMLSDTRHPHMSHYFIGPSDAVNSALSATLATTAPRANVAGFSVGPFPPILPEYVQKVSDEIIRKGGTVVWVGIGTPAQNFLVHELARVSGLVVIGVGAAFEFLSGMKPEAPRWMSFLGFEWLYRLISEPRRLWRRYLIGNTVFLYSFVAFRLRRWWHGR